MGLYEYVTKLYELYSFNTGKCSRYLSVESDIRKDVIINEEDFTVFSYYLIK